MKKISLDKFKRKRTLRLIKIAFGGNNGKSKTNKQKSTRNVKRKTR